MVDPKIRSLLAVVDMRSYTKAASTLSLTQPSVSHHIRLLEQEYGIRIFYANKKNLRLTPEGEHLVKYARRIVKIDNDARQTLSDCRDLVCHLTIGISPAAGESVFPQALALYCADHPLTHVTTLSQPTDTLLTNLKGYALDLVVMEGRPDDQTLPFVPLNTDRLCLVVPARHPFASRQDVSLENVRKERLILRPKKMGTRPLIDAFLAARSLYISDFNLLMEVDSASIIKDLVALNMGISILAYSDCKADLLSGRLVAVPFDNTHLVREVSLVFNKDFDHPEILDDLHRLYDSLI